MKQTLDSCMYLLDPPKGSNIYQAVDWLLEAVKNPNHYRKVVGLVFNHKVIRYWDGDTATDLLIKYHKGM